MANLGSFWFFVYFLSKQYLRPLGYCAPQEGVWIELRTCPFWLNLTEQNNNLTEPSRTCLTLTEPNQNDTNLSDPNLNLVNQTWNEIISKNILKRLQSFSMTIQWILTFFWLMLSLTPIKFEYSQKNFLTVILNIGPVIEGNFLCYY